MARHSKSSLGLQVASVFDQILGVDHVIDFAVVNAIQKGNSACFKCPIPYVGSFLSLKMGIVPRGLLEGSIPLLAVFLKKFRRLAFVVAVDRLDK